MGLASRLARKHKRGKPMDEESMMKRKEMMGPMDESPMEARLKKKHKTMKSGRMYE